LLVVGEGEAGAGKDVEPEVASAFDPVVVLLGKDGADEADQGVAGGEDADYVGPAADLSVQSFDAYLDQIWRQISLGNAVNASTSARFCSRWSPTLGSFSVSAFRTRSYCA
jgi:hypothetical protein